MGRTIQVSGFPTLLSAERIRMIFSEHELLRNIVGTIYAIQVKIKQEPGSRAYAIVQFTHSLDEDTLMRLRNFRPRCGNSYLKFWDQKDIVPNPRTYDNVMEGVTLNLGCQVSQDEFSVLWNAADVCVRFGTGLKVMHLLLCHELVEYRLQLYYDNIWQIVLYDSGIHAPKLLLIQVCF